MTVLFAAGTLLHYVFGIGMFLVSVFLILLVLVQRGRGGGLTGALGGMGGQSAFGAKAGDVFTRVTMVTAGIWIALCMGSIWMLNAQDEWQGGDQQDAAFSSPDSGGDQETPPDGGAAGAVGDGEAGAETSGNDEPVGAVDTGSAEQAPADADPGSSDSDAAEPPPSDSEAGEAPADEPDSNS